MRGPCSQSVTRLRFLLVATVVVLGATAKPQVKDGTNPIGPWRTVDDVTGRVSSVVVLWEAGGKLNGSIEKLIDPDPRDPDPRCVRCDGDLKDRRLVGLRILWGLMKNGDQWSGGRILDPGTGKIYNCSITLKDGGKTLRVHGFLGVSWFGRTQYWMRDE